MKYLITIGLIFNLMQGISQTFREEEISFKNGDLTLSATLSFPSSKNKKVGAIILVSGSGPQNRDSEIFGFKPFKLLADFFNQQGYAVLRYDDRGVAKSTGKSVNESTTADLAEDAHQAFLYLKTRKDIDIKKIGLLGHSEGGFVVPMVAAQEPSVAFVILAAGFGVKGVELSNAQQAAILRASGMSEDFISASTTMNKQVMTMMTDSTITDEKLAEFVKVEVLKLLPLLPENIQSQIPDNEAYANMGAQQAVMQSKSPWIRYYMNYDPLPLLKKVKCPALLLFGELDTQVLATQNSDLMREALLNAGNKNVTAITISKANHLFQEAQTGSPAEYSSLKKEFIPEFLYSMQKWLTTVK
jgi:pimeloyl-ACP methyl ester carboxylesterase